MKRLIAVILLCMTLVGCGAFIDDTFLAIEKHSETQTEPTELAEDAQSIVTNRNELRSSVLTRIRDWVEHDILPVENYDGDLSADLAEIVRHATVEDPFGAYAVDFIDAQLSGTAKSGSIELSIVFRRSNAEVNSIVTVSNNTQALRRIYAALTTYETALTLRIRSFEEIDFNQAITEYCLKNLNIALCVPEVSAEVYPPTGETRILELHFSYPATREEMRSMLSSANTILTSAANYVEHGQTDLERLELLTNFLTSRWNYQIADHRPTMPAYDLLCKHIAHSLSFAAVFRYECTLAGIECWLVSGTKDGLPHDWNIVCIDDVYYHLDLMRTIENDPSASLLNSAQAMQNSGYRWDEAAYPANEEPTAEPYIPTDSQATTAIEPTEAATESTEAATEPTEEITEPEENN